MPSSRVVPVLGYSSPTEAADWLVRVLGFEKRLAIGDHRVQLTFGESALVVAASSVEPAPAQVSTMLRVASADELYARALDHGATSVGEPVTYPYGERQATVRDPWGHVWTLSETVADSDPADWGGELLGG